MTMSTPEAPSQEQLDRYRAALETAKDGLGLVGFGPSEDLRFALAFWRVEPETVAWAEHHDPAQPF